jgi:ribosomal protein L11 methyltransferase
VSVDVPEEAVEVFEAALASACDTVGLFRDHASGTWRVEGVREVNKDFGALEAALLLASELAGLDVPLRREATVPDGWLARSYASFPEQRIGRHFAVRGTHLRSPASTGRITLTLDAGLAFGSGEHGSTRGCIRALEAVAWRQPRRILDLGTGSGVLAMAAAHLLRRKVLAIDIEPWSVWVAQRNVALNRLGRLVAVRLADGWRHATARRRGPYDLIFANILARPLCLMARQLALHLLPGGTAILSGLLESQIRAVLAAHRHCGLRLEAIMREGPWVTLVLRRPARAVSSRCNPDRPGGLRRRPGRRHGRYRSAKARYRTARDRSSSPFPA